VEEIFTKVPNRHPKKDENVFPLFIRYFGLLKKQKLGLIINKKSRAISDPAFPLSRLNRDLFFNLLSKS
jgi:hypothetical protein